MNPSDEKILGLGRGLNYDYLYKLRYSKNYKKIEDLFDLIMVSAHLVARMEKPLLTIGYGDVYNQHLGLLISSNYGCTTNRMTSKIDYVNHSLVPDSGLTYYFSRLPKNIGFY